MSSVGRMVSHAGAESCMNYRQAMESRADIRAQDEGKMMKTSYAAGKLAIKVL